jgi:hypothetical protein
MNLYLRVVNFGGRRVVVISVVSLVGGDRFIPKHPSIFKTIFRGDCPSVVSRYVICIAAIGT